MSPRHVRAKVKLKAKSEKLEISVIWGAIGEVGADASVGPRGQEIDCTSQRNFIPCDGLFDAS